MQYTVVVDGGGSGCRAGAFDSQGRLCATAQNGPASLTLGVEQAWQHISMALADLATQLSLPSAWLPDSLHLGLAGALQHDRRQAFLAQVPDSISCSVVTDGHAQLLGACGGSAGACLAVGTGSVLHWLDEAGGFSQAGGWGFPAGDEASGAWLGQRLVNHYLWHLDGAACLAGSRFLLELKKHLGSSVSDVQAWSTCKSPTQLATLAQLLPPAIAEGDALALALQAEGCDECCRLIALAPAQLPVCVVGGLAVLYQEPLASVLGNRLQAPRGDALKGLHHLATHEREHEART